MNKTYYKFRSTEHLFKELENQEIYFSSQNELNDPMDSFKNIYFQGDDILWCNLFKHYLLCLTISFTLYIVDSGENFYEQEFPIFTNENLYEDIPLGKTFSKIKNDFFYRFNVEKFAALISTRTSPVRSEELLLYLNKVHFIALKCISSIFVQEGLMPQSNFMPDKLFEKDICEDIAILIQGYNNQENSASSTWFIHSYSAILNKTKEDIILEQTINFDIPIEDNRRFLLYDYPKIFIENLEKLMHPQCYFSCFTSEYKNSVMWSHYAESHKGVCLIFKPKGKGIKLSTCTGFSSEDGEIWKFVEHSFKKVNYTTSNSEFNFFTNLGSITRPIQISSWLMYNGKKSKIDMHENLDSDEWRERYWKELETAWIKKYPVWDYEKEYRLPLYDLLDDVYEKMNPRTIKYDFLDLSGIILGAKMSTSNKIKVMGIIKDKCKNYPEHKIEVHQAFFDKNGNIEISLTSTPIADYTENKINLQSY